MRGLIWLPLGGRGTCDQLLWGMDRLLLEGRGTREAAWRGLDGLLLEGRVSTDIAASKDNLKIQEPDPH